MNDLQDVNALAQETLDSMRDYLPRLIQGTHTMDTHLVEGREEEAFGLLSAVAEGVRWLVSAVLSLQKNGFLDDLDLTPVTNMLFRSEEEVERSDLRAAVRVLVDEARPLLEGWLERLNRQLLVGIIFSKDRAMQLDATLRSYYQQGADAELAQMKVLYVTSNAAHDQQYEWLKQEYLQVEFIRETAFRAQLLQTMRPFKNVLFLVDDNLFVKRFSLGQTLDHLEDPAVLGYSLRLGQNTTYCYMLDRPQAVPAHEIVAHEDMRFNWTQAQHDFGYSLEVSSSVYRVTDMLTVLETVPFKNPNTLEEQMAAKRFLFAQTRPYSVCPQQSFVFGNPINLVQTVVLTNRVGQNGQYSAERLLQMFQEGYRVDVAHYAGLVIRSVQQEEPLQFVKSHQPLPASAPAVDNESRSGQGSRNHPMRNLPQSERVKPWFRDKGDETHRLNYDLNEDSVVFDLGGYEGNFARDIYCLYGSTVHVFEPVPAFAHSIEQRFKRNRRVHVHNFGLSGATRLEKISISQDATSTFKQGANAFDIRLVRAEDFFHKQGIETIDLMKINIEGGEYELLEHLIESGWIHRIKNIQVQFHDFVPNAGDRMDAIHEQLAKTHGLTYQYLFVWENWLRTDK